LQTKRDNSEQRNKAGQNCFEVTLWVWQQKKFCKDWQEKNSKFLEKQVFEVRQVIVLCILTLLNVQVAAADKLFYQKITTLKQ